jgi:hypothetical protein
VHQGDLDVTGSFAQLRRAPEVRGPVGSRTVLGRVLERFVEGVEEDQDAVGLAQAEIQPGRVGELALEDHEVVLGRDAVEPLGEAPIDEITAGPAPAVVRLPCDASGQTDRRARSGQELGHLAANAVDLGAADAQQGDAPRKPIPALAERREDLRRGHHVDGVRRDERRQVQRQLGMSLGQREERPAFEPKQVRVADGVHVDRRRPTAQQERFPDATAPEGLEEHAGTVVAVDERASKPSVEDQHERHVRLAALHDARAAGHVHRFQRGVDALQDAGAQSPKDRPCREQVESLDRRRLRHAIDDPPSAENARPVPGRASWLILISARGSGG